MLTLHNYANADAAVINLLKTLRINVNPTDVISEMEKHPDNPSMLAISDVLNWFQIPNAAYRIEENDLKEVPTPFIAHTKRNNDFVTVKNITDEIVVLSDDKRGSYKLSREEFKKIYNGVVLSADAPEQTATFKPTIFSSLSFYKIPLSIVGLALAFIAIILFRTNYLSNLTWQILALTFFKTAGLVTSVLLLVQSIDKNNPLVQTLCGGGGKTNCNAILTSKAATVFDGLTWSEVGFFYFAATWLALLFGGTSSAVLNTLALLNIISLPYTIYSINYQARIAKQWCVFCTVVQALLWLEFIPFLTLLKRPLTVSANALGSLVIFAMIPVAIWLLLKPLLLKSQQLTALKSQLQKFKYNRELFEATLKEQPKYAIPADDWSIVLGNVEANTIITMVSNPYCQPCSKTHAEFEELLEKLDDIQLRVVFTANNSEYDIKTPVTRHLMALNAQSDKTIVKHALTDWYNQKQKNYEAWAKIYPVTLDETKFNILEKQKAWCDMAEIKSTPTLLVNGYRLPQAYRLHDIKYMLQ